MAKYYLLPKHLVDRVTWLRTPVWLFEAAFFYTLLGIARLMPFPVAPRVFARVVGGLGYRNTRKREVVLANLAVVLPDATTAERDRVARDIFRSIGYAAVELFLLERLWQRRARYIEFHLHPEAEAAITRKEAILFVTAHTGAWQLTPLIGRHYGLSLSVLYAPERNPWLNRFFIGRRRAFGGPLVPTIGGGREVIRELAAGRSVGAAFDTRVDQGEMVPFFGVPTPTNTLPAMLALRGHKVLPTRAVRLPGCRYRVEVMAPLTPADAAVPRKAQVRNLTEQINTLFEGWIRTEPGQWICMKRRWPKSASTKTVRDD